MSETTTTKQRKTTTSLSRRPIKAGIRWEVFKRDNFTCVYCGEGVSITSPKDHYRHAVIDHVEAVAHKGGNHTDNYVTSCLLCNAKKGKKSILEFLKWQNNDT